MNGSKSLTKEAKRAAPSRKEQGSYSEAPLRYEPLAEYDTHRENTQVSDRALTAAVHVPAPSGSTTGWLKIFVTNVAVVYMLPPVIEKPFLALLVCFVIVALGRTLKPTFVSSIMTMCRDYVGW